MAKFDDQATDKIEAWVYISIDIIVILLSVWMSISLIISKCYKNQKIRIIIFWIPIAYYLLSIIGSAFAIYFDITFIQIYLNIFAAIFVVLRVLLGLFITIRLYFTFKESAYRLSKFEIIILGIILIITILTFLAYTIKFCLALNNPSGIDSNTFIFVIIAMFLDSILSIIVAFLFFKKLFLMISALTTENNFVYELSRIDSNDPNNPNKSNNNLITKISLNSQQRKMIYIITKHTLLCCIASITIQIYTIFRLISWFDGTIFYGSPIRIITMAILNGIFYVSTLFSIHLGFHSVDNQYQFMCKYCHKVCEFCCIKLTQRKVRNSILRNDNNNNYQILGE